MAVVVGAALLAITMILFGAPATSHQSLTVLCAAHMALLAGPALIKIHGLDPSTWYRLVALLVPLDEPMGAAVGTLIGAWLGAVPIPLDW